MLSIVLITLTILATIYTLKREQILSPLGIHVLIAAGTAVTFYIVSVLELRPDDDGGSFLVSRDYSRQADGVLWIYLALVGLAVLISIVSNMMTRRRANSTATVTRPVVGASASVFEGSFVDSPSTRLALAIPLIAVALVALCHAVSLDWSHVWRQRAYLEVVAPEDAGIQNPGLRLFHLGLGMMGFMMAVLVAFFSTRRMHFHAVLAGVLMLYSFTISLSNVSRAAPLQLAILGASLRMLGGRRRWPRAISTLLFISSVMLFDIVLTTRGGSVFGIVGILRTVDSGQPFDGGNIVWLMWSLALTTFGGGFVTANAIAGGGLSYPAAYKWLSFSPFPSVIDHFDSVFSSGETRVSSYVPFGAISEAYAFGPTWFIAFFVLLGLILLYLTYFWKSSQSRFKLLYAAPAFLGLVLMHMYPIRNCERLFYISVVICLVASIRASGSKSNKGAKAEGRVPTARGGGRGRHGPWRSTGARLGSVSKPV